MRAIASTCAARRAGAAASSLPSPAMAACANFTRRPPLWNHHDRPLCPRLHRCRHPCHRRRLHRRLSSLHRHHPLPRRCRHRPCLCPCRRHQSLRHQRPPRHLGCASASRGASLGARSHPKGRRARSSPPLPPTVTRSTTTRQPTAIAAHFGGSVAAPARVGRPANLARRSGAATPRPLPSRHRCHPRRSALLGFARAIQQSSASTTRPVRLAGSAATREVSLSAGSAGLVAFRPSPALPDRRCHPSRPSSTLRSASRGDALATPR